MSKKKSNIFSLYFWLLKKLKNKLLLWYFSTFVSLFFYYQTTSYGLKHLWGYKNSNPPFQMFLWKINSRAGLIFYLLLAFFIIYLFTSIICEYLKNYSLELCRFNLRKLILTYSKKNLTINQKYQKEILNNFFGEVELFTPTFILIPHKIFNAIISIILNFFFLSSLQNDIGNSNFAIYFIIFLSMVLIVLSFLSYQVQIKINRQENNLRHQENILFEEYLEKKKGSQKLKNLIDKNFRQNRHSFWKKAFSALSYLIIPGLGILFCFVYSYYQAKNSEIKEFVQIYSIAGSLQTIFFKVKDIIDSLPEISKGKIYYKSLQSIFKRKSTRT